MTTYAGADWTLENRDCVDGVGGLADSSVDLSVYSPPFVSLYTYTASERDMGNCTNAAEFFAHFGFLQRELLRVTKPGRVTCCHVAQIAAILWVLLQIPYGNFLMLAATIITLYSGMIYLWDARKLFQDK